MPEAKKTVRKPSAYNIHMRMFWPSSKRLPRKTTKEYVQDAFTACAAAYACKKILKLQGVAKSVKKSVKSTRK
jgi:hypothetical protein